MPKDVFVCLGCRAQSRILEIRDAEKAPYVVCPHCGTKNKLLRLRTFLGGAAEYTAIGIRLEDDQ